MEDNIELYCENLKIKIRIEEFKNQALSNGRRELRKEVGMDPTSDSGGTIIIAG